jgi:hypothetical protein
MFRLKKSPSAARLRVGRSGRSDPKFLRRAPRGGSVGRVVPTQYFFAALRAAGRSVGTDRLETTQNGDPWVGRSDTQIRVSTSHRHVPCVHVHVCLITICTRPTRVLGSVGPLAWSVSVRSPYKCSATPFPFSMRCHADDATHDTKLDTNLFGVRHRTCVDVCVRCE